MNDLSMSLPVYFQDALEFAHPSWHTVIAAGLREIDARYPGYFTTLLSAPFLPDQARLFAAFSLPLHETRFVLMGEGPYPRSESATGYCFMDGAVSSLWHQHKGEWGLSKPVNRATSLRNFMKMLMVADGWLAAEQSNAASLSSVLRQRLQKPEAVVQNMQQLQERLLAQGMLLLNASLVFRTHQAPAFDVKVWSPFMETVLEALSKQQPQVALILWGKLAERFQGLAQRLQFQVYQAEHPYNLSFIANQTMQDLFRPMKLLQGTF